MKYSAGPLAHEKLMRCIELYGREVIPRCASCSDELGHHRSIDNSSSFKLRLWEAAGDPMDATIAPVVVRKWEITHAFPSVGSTGPGFRGWARW